MGIEQTFNLHNITQDGTIYQIVYMTYGLRMNAESDRPMGTAGYETGRVESSGWTEIYKTYTMAWRVGLDDHGKWKIENDGRDLMGLDKELTQVCSYRAQMNTFTWFEAGSMDRNLKRGKMCGGKRTDGPVNDDLGFHPYYGAHCGKMGYERKTPIVRGTRVIARHVHLATTSEESVLDFRVDTQYWDYCVDRERLLMECERAPQLKRFIPDLCLPPVSESDDDESPGDAGNGDARDNGGNDGAGGGAGAGDGAGYGSAEPSKDSGAVQNRSSARETKT